MSKKNVRNAIRFVDFVDAQKGELMQNTPVYLKRDLVSVSELAKTEPVATVNNTRTRLDIFNAGDKYLGIEYTILN